MSTDTEHVSFLGIRVEGDITKPERRVEQRPLSELEPLIRAVLADETIHSFGWTQYTPYFNDGDPCVFAVNEVWIRTIADVTPKQASDEDDEDEDDFDSEDGYRYTLGYSGHPTLGKRDYDWVGDYPNRKKIPGEYEGTDEARYDRCEALIEAIGSAAFDDVLLDAFGDHARVMVRASGITVDEYSHD